MRTKWRLSVVLVLIAAGTLSDSAMAQTWVPVLSTRAISTVYFLDQFGAPNVGFASAVAGIYQTTDGGTTWRLCPKTGGYAVRDFTFKDAQTGWAVASNSATVLKTTDGGSSWIPRLAPNPGTTIRYAAQTHALFMSYPIQGDSRESTDDGATWTPAPAPGLNGLAFADASSGVWSSHGNFPLYWTTDGGQLWQVSNLQHHIFSPTALGAGRGFYALSEVDDSGFLSLDGGGTWAYRGSFPSGLTPAYFYFMGSTGCVQYSNGYLWTQTTTDGMFLSTDTGRSWISLCGPSQTYDSRFYARGKMIFAFDNSALYEDADGTILPPPAKLVLTPDTPRVEVPPCGRASAIATLSILNTCRAELDSLYLTGSSNLTLETNRMPTQLPDDGAFGIDDRDNGQSRDTGFLHIVWRTNGAVKDTVLTVYGSIGGEPETLSLPALSNIRLRACSRYDTTVLFTSISCDTLRVLSVHLTDSTLLNAASWATLPAILLSQDVLPIRLTGTFSHPGDYRDSLLVRVELLPAGTLRDTTIPIFIHVEGVARPIVTNLTLRAKNGCDAIDTVLPLENMHCSFGWLDSVSVDDSSAALPLDSFPILLPSDSSIGLALRLQPTGGTIITDLTLHFTIDGVRMDTDVFVTVTAPKSAPTPGLSASRIAFGPSSLCSATAQVLVFRNPQCDTLSLTQLRWSYADPELWFDTTALPILLAPGESDTIRVHYHPAGNWAASGALDLSFQLGGRTHDTVIGVTGIGTDAPTAALITDTLLFPTLTACETGIDSSRFVNTSCDTLLITNVQDWSPGGFAEIAPTLPVKLAPGDSMTFTFQFSPSQDGAYLDSISIEYRSLASPNIRPSVQLMLLGSSQTPRAPLELHGADFSALPLPPCGDWDSSFTIRNPNGCDTLTLDSLWASSQDLSIVSDSPLPARLAPDSEVTIHLHFAPSHDTEAVTFRCAGTNLDTAITLAFFRSRLDSFALAPQSAPKFLTNACRPVTQTFAISGGGACDSVWVDSLLLSNALSKFSFAAAPAVPFLLSGTDTVRVTYDPNGSGADSTDLIVASPQKTLSLHVPLVGSDAEVPPIARCALSIDGTTRDTVRPGATVTLALRTLDAIPDSMGLSEVSFQLHFNDDVLTEQRIAAAPGFILGPTQYKTGFLSLDLLRKAGTSVSAGGEIASIDFYVTVADSISTPVALSDLRFNPGDTTYERCTLASEAAMDSAFVTVANFCGAPLLRNLLSGNLQVLGVRPTLVTSGAMVSVDLSVRVASQVRFRVFTEDGVELWNEMRSLAAGREVISLPLARMPQGAAFLQVTDGHESYIRKIAFE